MKYWVPILAVTALLSAAAPSLASARPHGDGDGGGWRGQNGDGGAWRARGGDDGDRGGGRRDDGPVYAEPPRPNSLREGYAPQQDEAYRGVREGRMQSLGSVVEGIRRRQPGRLLDGGLEAWGDGRPAYRVRWAAANGRRIDFIVDARTGAILSEEGR